MLGLESLLSTHRDHEWVTCGDAQAHWKPSHVTSVMGHPTALAPWPPCGLYVGLALPQLHAVMKLFSEQN